MGWFTDLAVPIGGALISGYVSSKNTKKAQKSLDQGTNAALDEQRRQFDIERGDTAQQRSINEWAMNRLKGMSEGSVNVQDIPGYQFAQNEGQKRIERSAAANGMLNSGRTGRELTRYGSDYAQSAWGNEWNRLAGLAGLGAGGIGAGGGPSTNIANLYGQQGQQGASIAGAQNAGLQGSIQNVVDAFTRSSLLDRLG